MRRSEELAMAMGHVRDGERRILEQEVLVGRLLASGYQSEQAVELLSTFNTTLDLMRDHLHVIEGEIDAERQLKKRAHRARIKALAKSIQDVQVT